MLKSFGKNIKRVYKYSYGSRKYIVVYLVLSFVIMVIGVVFPILSSLQLVNLTEGVWDKVIIYSLFSAFLSIFRNILDIISSISSRKFSKIVIAKIQIELGKEILQLELSDIDKHSNGVFMQRLTGDANEISSIFTFGVTLINDIIRDIGTIIIVFFINFKIGLLYIAYIILSIIFQKIKLKKINKKDQGLREQREETSGFTAELIRGIRDIKMLNAENSFIKKVEDNVKGLNSKMYQIGNLRDLFFLLESSIRHLFELFLILLIVYGVKNGEFVISVGLVIYNYRYSVTNIVTGINLILDYIREFNMSCDRVFALFGSNDFKKEKFGTKHLKKINGDFEFEHVEFSYGEHDVLKDISFKINANETVAFVGKSGSGKTTIFNLICKFYDANKGKIKIDGIDINKLDKDSIRGNITIISQNPYIFNMSIRDNLKLVREDLEDEEMKEACKLACLDDYISTLPNGYDTIIGEAGVKLSGGQKQRLAIARALVQKTEIILFDEATSALDNETQAKIQKSIENMKNEYTILIIAHRLSTIMNCDRILFIEDGKILCEGNHSYLLKNCNSYKKLYESEYIEKNK